MKHFLLGILLCWLPLTALADHPTTLDHLLRQVQDAAKKDAQARRAREARFLEANKNQKALLNEVTRELANERARSNKLKDAFAANEKALAKLQGELDQKAGDLGELFGTVRQFADELGPLMGESLVSAQHPDRDTWFRVLAESKRLPDITELERFWLLTQQEILESGRVVEFEAPVVAADGSSATLKVTRIGLFDVIANGRYLNFNASTGQLQELARQPSRHDLGLAEDFSNSSESHAEIALDPTRGVLLGLLVETPNTTERIQQGGLVGYIILAIGALGIAIGVWRLLYLTGVNGKVQKQIRNPEKVSDKNPLGRILGIAERNPDADPETFGLQIDEAVMAELPRLTRGEGLVKLLAAVAPLLGLLGTVVGMIVTFQSISLFGTGDPKLMANGISQALVTTALGLIVAVPLLFLHSLISARSKAVISVLDEQSAGLLAARQEQR